MAAVILGGLVTTTLLSLFVVPALYLRFGSHQPEMSPDEELLLQEWAQTRTASARTAVAAPEHAADDAEAVMTADAGVVVADGHDGAGEPPPGSRSTTSEAVARSDDEQGGEHGELGLSPA
jgi:hypothetical protein